MPRCVPLVNQNVASGPIRSSNSSKSCASDERYWLTELEWIAEGDDAAACTYRFNWRAGGNSGSGRGTTVLARTSAGWRIVHEHLSKTT